MKISKKTYRIVDIGDPDQYEEFGQSVMDMRKRYGLKTICARCRKSIEGPFIVTIKKGHPNYLFHSDCFDTPIE